MFDKLLEFCKENMFFLILCIIYFILVLLYAFKKKVKVVDSIFEMVLVVLPSYIREAEKLFTGAATGPDKYSYVFNRCVELLVLLTGNDKQRVIQDYTAKINASIENILSTPEKKKER